MRHAFLLLRFPSHSEDTNFLPLFGRLPIYAKRISNWQQIELHFEPKAEDGFLFLIFNKVKNASSQLLGVELRNNILWIVSENQALETKIKRVSPFRFGIGMISISGQHAAALIAAGNEEEFEYFVSIDSNELRPAFEAEISGILETASEDDGHPSPLGRNILLGGSNWTTEGEIGRGVDKFWSGLGRRKDFSGCIKK